MVISPPTTHPPKFFQALLEVLKDNGIQFWDPFNISDSNIKLEKGKMKDEKERNKKKG